MAHPPEPGSPHSAVDPQIQVLEDRLLEQSRAAQEQAVALDAFISFSQASSTVSDVHALARQASELLRLILGDVSVVYYDLDGELWKAAVMSEDIPDETAHEIRAGVPVSAPSYAEAVRTRQAVFVAGWDAEREGVARSESYGAGAMYPCFVGDELAGLLAMGIQRSREWTSLERRIFVAVGSSLSVALTRSVQARRREEQVQAVFARFTAQIASAQDLGALVHTAAEIIQDGVSGSGCVFYRWSDGEFRATSFSSGVPPEIRAVRERVSAALPVVAQALQTGEIAFAEQAAGQRQVTPGGPFQALAAMPFFLSAQPYALLGVSSVRPVWSAPERALLTTISQGLGVAISRLEHNQALELERETLNAFVAFTEAADQLRDLGALSDAAFAALTRLFPGCGATVLEWRPAPGHSRAPSSAPDSGLWQSRQRTANIAPALAQVIEAGLPSQTPILARMVETGAPVFVDGWTPEAQGVAHTTHFESAGVYPVTQGGVIVAALSIGIEGHRHWQPREQAILGAIGRSFTLLYDRFQAAEVLLGEKREAESRTRTLEIFARLSTELRAQEDRYGLIQRAQEVLFSMLPPGYTAYWEPEGGRWQAQALRGEVHPGLQPIIDAGVPVGRSPTLDGVWHSQQPLYQDEYPAQAELPPELRAHLNSLVALPIRVRGETLGVLSYATAAPHAWRAIDRAVLSTLTESLELALERALSVRQLAERSGELERSNAELKAANEELEAFASSASHDLRTPVRHVKGFAELARKAMLGGNLAKATAHLGVIEGAADRMSALIDAMLQLSRSTRQALRREPVDLKLLVEQARHDVAQDLAGRSVQWRIAELPVVVGDAATLQQVVTNLISNAVKFTSTVPAAQIDIWSERQPDHWVVHLSDNGVGFDPQYQAKLFGVFQRLHSEREFEGTGVGLATVRRIVLRHGGRVWAESQVGQGATFSFSLPL
jgi:signal transduction histidine kinase